MTDFSEKKFLSLTPARQIKVSLDVIHKIEEIWADGESEALAKIAEKLQEKLLTYLGWLNTTETGEALRLPSLLTSLRKDISIRKILNIAIAFERFLNMSLKDHEILVTTKDRPVTEPFKPALLPPLYVVLDNLRSGFNVGSAFRAAECLGVHHIYLVGYSPTPEHKAVKKTAMGTDAWVPWSTAESVFDLISDFKEKGITTVGMETSKTAINLYEAETRPELALFLGNERFGLQPDVLERMDLCVEIPMCGRKNSLNISNALAIGVSEIQRSWMQKGYV